jgi:hypothetical protein
MAKTEKNDEIKVTFDGREVIDVCIEYSEDDKRISNYIDSTDAKKITSNERGPVNISQIDFRMNDKWLVHECRDDSGAILVTQMIPSQNIIHVEIHNTELENRLVRIDQLDDTQAEQMK